jgi:hypothetical protein
MLEIQWDLLAFPLQAQFPVIRQVQLSEPGKHESAKIVGPLSILVFFLFCSHQTFNL